jgi:pimeloyl-ACP methyl ester carboxylesterase
MKPVQLARCFAIAAAFNFSAACANGTKNVKSSKEVPVSPQAKAALTPTEMVTLTTRDSVALKADLYAPFPSSRCAILLHMIPPRFNRTSYPEAFIRKLVDAQFTVLNLDRRGAGESQGQATDAYRGPKGAFDVAAAAEFLKTKGCKPQQLTVIGASNGTTSALDYAVWSSTQPDALEVGALVFLTGGAYTDAQQSLASVREAMAKVPVMFVFSTEERAWSAQFQSNAPAPWKFLECNPGEHGTNMFKVRPNTADDIVMFLKTVFG